MPTRREILSEFTADFAAAGAESPETDAKWLVATTLGVTPNQLWLDLNQTLESAEVHLLRQLARRRSRHEPLQYILGSAPFRNLELTVTPDVLIPRPETELLVDWVLKHLPHGGTLLDVGTGSGAIALAAASERPDARVLGCDISLAALAVAEGNRIRLKLANVEFIGSDLFSGCGNRSFDLIAANLPYVSEAEYEELMPEVRDHEPKLALTAPDDGYELIGKLAAGLRTRLKPKGAAIFELAPSQARRLCAQLEHLGFKSAIERDYTGRDRFVTAEVLK